jgi:pimeloyl-ACP methyl ester carboxylesterase
VLLLQDCSRKAEYRVSIRENSYDIHRRLISRFRRSNGFVERIRNLLLKADSYDLISEPTPIIPNVDVFRLVSQEASELRRSGQLLQLAESILCPVVAIHGDYDPHPYKGVQEPLSRVLKDFRMVLLKDCGHDPWLERAARESFFDILKEELTSLTCS